MTAIEDARAALADLTASMIGRPGDGSKTFGVVIPQVESALRALIAEHQRQNAVLNEIKRLVDDGNPHWRLRQELRLLEDTDPPRSPIAARTWDRVHNRPADIYTPPEDRIAPPTDDEHKALTESIRSSYAGWRAAADFDEWLATFRRQEPHTDEWEYGVLPLVLGDELIRRRKAGPWEPVEAARDTP